MKTNTSPNLRSFAMHEQHAHSGIPAYLTNQWKTVRSILIVSVLVWLTGDPLAYGALITPAGVNSSTAGTDLFPAVHLIDNSGVSAGFTAASTHAGYASTNSWVTSSYNPDYFASGPVPVLIFDLGSTWSLSDIVIWQYAAGNVGTTSRSITVDFSSTGVGGTWSGGVVLPLAQSSLPSGVEPSQTLSLGSSFTANAVRVTITDNYFGIGGAPGGDRVGLSEVKFEGAAVPEPGTLGLIAIGGGLLVMLRRRRAA